MSGAVIDSPEAMEAFGARLVATRQPPLLVFLHGDLGAGKTTLVRGALRALGHTGAVKSPTYTLIEPYEPGGVPLYHIDLYRLSDPGEIDYLGVRELLDQAAWVFIEWPERGGGWLPQPDVSLHLAVTGASSRHVDMTERESSVGTP